METIIITIQVANLTDEEQLALKKEIQKIIEKYPDKRIDIQIIGGRTF